MKTSGELRAQMPFLSNLVYFDSAGVIPCPAPVVNAMHEYYCEYPFNYGGTVFSASKKATILVDRSRESLACFINAHSAKEIIFTRNATEAINLVSEGIEFLPGDEIVITNLEHQSNIIPWMRLQQEKGVVLKIAWAKDDGLIKPKDILNLISHRTKLVSITHVSNIFGTIQPIKEIGQVVKKAGSLFMVDAAQSGGRIPINVQDIDCDFLCLTGRKSIMGPQGTGALYVREPLLNTLRPVILGSRAGNIIDHQNYELLDAPHRFEAGILNTAGVIGLGKAVECLMEIGVENIFYHLQDLTRKLLSELLNFPGIQVYGCRDMKSLAGIISWNVADRKSIEVAHQLDELKHIAVSAGTCGSSLSLKPLGIKEVIRTSFSYFNNNADIGHLMDGLKSIHC